LTAECNGGQAAHEDLMTLKFPVAKWPVANRLAVLLTAIAVIAVGFDITPAGAASPKRPVRTDDRGRPYYGPNGPNVVYQQGPHTRIYVTKRSWLDAGVEVLPGDRKFTDYALPPAIGVTPFDQNINNRSIVRAPLNPPSDMGGLEPTRFPLY
jgi:hypothetical protein